MAAPKVLKILIVTPAPPGSRAGNRNTAVRWRGILRSLGCKVAVRTEWGGEPCDLLIALHARKSRQALVDFTARYPERPALLALTGTDLYRDIRCNDGAAASLDLASRLIVLQQAALAELSPTQRRKARVIHQSVAGTPAHRPPVRGFRACVLGHLREEKDPFRAALALQRLPAERIELVQAGQALSPQMARVAGRLMLEDLRYRWVGELPHGQALRLLARSHLMVISSCMEGGAHVVSEAIAIGVPVIASDIPGNRGLLGERYPGYFPAGNEAALAQLLKRAAHDARFLERLAAAVRRRRPLVAPERERQAWQQLLAEFRADR